METYLSIGDTCISELVRNDEISLSVLMPGLDPGGQFERSVITVVIGEADGRVVAQEIQHSPRWHIKLSMTAFS